MYRWQDFGNVPRRRRRAALELKLPVWSPFPRTGYHCVWSDTAAMVWFWDEDEVLPAAGPEDFAAVVPDSPAVAAGSLRVRPETVFYPRKSDGVHLQPCQHGFELQYWRGEVLEDSFWLPQRPDCQRIEWFLDRHGLQRPAAELAESASEIAAQPWSSPLTAPEWLAAHEWRLVASALVILALAVIWQETRYWKALALNDAITSEHARLRDELGPVLETRDELLRLRRRGGRLAEILSQPSQAYLMGLVDQALPDARAQLHQWRYQQGELRMIVEAADLDPIAYVKALEAYFERVAVGASQRSDRIEITLDTAVREPS